MKKYKLYAQKHGSFFVLILIAIIMCYPLLWLFFASFKSNHEIFTSLSVFPRDFTFEGYINALKGIGRMPFKNFFLNSTLLAIPTVLFTIFSSVLVAYGFCRFDFRFKNWLLGLMISTLMLPNTIIMIPRYIIFMKLGWLNSYKPFYALALFATNPFFSYLLIQFFRGVPRQLDESAYLDGCSPFKILIKIIVPLAKAPIVSVGLFQFLWTWNDFLNSLIYINSVKLYPISLSLQLAIASDATIGWNKVIAMTVLGMAPCVFLFFVFQRLFVEGIATSGIKG